MNQRRVDSSFITEPHSRTTSQVTARPSSKFSSFSLASFVLSLSAAVAAAIVCIMKFWRLWTAFYSRALDKHPLWTEMITSGTLWCLGDLATQRVEQWTRTTTNPRTTTVSSPTSAGDHNSGINWKRTAHQTMYASLLWGPVAHHWYHWLDRWANRIVTSRIPTRLLATKLVLEITCLHPVGLFAYFTVLGLLRGDAWEPTIRQQLQRDYLPSLALEVALWTPLDALNFAWVPVRHQLLVVNCGCLVESIGLSYIQNNAIAWEKFIPRNNLSSSSGWWSPFPSSSSSSTTSSSSTRMEKPKTS